MRLFVRLDYPAMEGKMNQKIAELLIRINDTISQSVPNARDTLAIASALQSPAMKRFKYPLLIIYAASVSENSFTMTDLASLAQGLMGFSRLDGDDGEKLGNFLAHNMSKESLNKLEIKLKMFNEMLPMGSPAHPFWNGVSRGFLIEIRKHLP